MGSHSTGVKDLRSGIRASLIQHGFKPHTVREILLADSGSIPYLIVPKGAVAFLE